MIDKKIYSRQTAKSKLSFIYYKLIVFLPCLLILISLTSCLRNNNTPIQVLPEMIETDSSNKSNNLDTTSNSDIDKWLLPIISEYLSDDSLPPPIKTCGHNTLTIENSQFISEQKDIDELGLANKIEGNLIIDSESNLDFSPLSLLQEVTGDFRLLGTAKQVTLSGFDCLSSVGGALDISGFDKFGERHSNSSLESISGFSTLKSIDGNLRIFDNIVLTDISDFPNLNSINGFFQISDDISLTNIASFPELSSIGEYFLIHKNSSLESFSSNFPKLSSIEVI